MRRLRAPAAGAAARAPRTKTSRPSSTLSEASGDQQRERVSVGEHVGARRTVPKICHGPAVVQVDRRALRAGLRGAAREDDVRGAGLP